MREGKEYKNNSILPQNLSMSDLESMSEQEIRFKLVREFVKQKIINKISEAYEEKIINS
jgi:hypothetical protein